MISKFNFKSIFIISLILTCLTTTQAQFAFGVKAGLNVSTQSNPGNLYDNQDLQPGLFVGGSAVYQFSDNWAAQVEVNYSQKRKKIKTNNFGEDNSLKNSCDYLTIPLLIRASALLNEKKIRIYGETGPYYGYLTNYATDKNDEFANDNRYYSNDIGLVFGGGIIQPIHDLNLIIGIRYDMGLVKVYRLDNDLRNKTICLNVGIQF